MSGDRITAQEHAQFMELAHQHGPNRILLGQLMGISDSRVSSHTRTKDYRELARDWKWRQQTYTLAPPPPSDPPRDHVAPVEVQPFAVPVPRAAQEIEGHGITSILFGDDHVPYHDPRVLAIRYAILQDVRPDIMLHMGDLVDCSQISRWPVDPLRESRLQEEIDASRVVLHQLAVLAPTARRVLLEGNHEARLHHVWENAIGRQEREVGRLRAIRTAMEWQNILGLDSIGWDFIPTEQQAGTSVIPKLVTTHGTTTGVRKWSTHSAKSAWERFGRSVAVGHCHRAGVAYHRDHNGQAFWIETGCGCELIQPYGSDFDWQQVAATVIEQNEDRSLMEVTQVVVRDGKALFRGREYRA